VLAESGSVRALNERIVTRTSARSPVTAPGSITSRFRRLSDST